jgi:nitronate monooxygenase
LAAGYLTAEVFAERVTAARSLTTGPLGVNLFVVRSSAARSEAIQQYAQALADESEHYGVRLGEARFDDDAWSAKLDVVLDLKPEVVSFTFGLPEAADCARLSAAGISTVATVTTLAEAEAAVACGVDAVAVQGPAAGGHRGTLNPVALPPTQPLDQLLRATTIALDVPVIAAGGLMTATDVADVLVSGAVAAQLGTAFLLADEAGSSPVHRAALRDPQFTETAVTRCFSGRYARGLRNRFIDEHDRQAPLGYPEIHYLTSPVRAASVRAGDPHAVNIWAGTGFKKALAGSVAEIMASLV